MPWYRMHGTMVHLKLSGKAAKNPPAPCCGRIHPHSNPVAPSIRCMAISTYLCDHELSDGKTCDAPLCAEHATAIDTDRHLCPRHAREREAA
jgi:hypothetical protein